MENEPNDTSTIKRYFSGLTENVFFSQLGVADTEITEYLASLLVRSVRTSTLHRFRTLRGKPTTELTTLLVEAKNRVGEAKRDIHCHIGDFTLFWSGLYPEALRSNPSESHNQFSDYCQEGKKAYEIASQIETDEKPPTNSLLERLSEQFDLCAYGLREIRRAWEDGSDGDKKVLLI